MENLKIIGKKTIVIDNLEIAQFDFPVSMNFDDAAKACSELGEGWRVPNRIELDLMFNNLNTVTKINKRKNYWSSEEDPINIDFAFGRDFMEANSSIYGTKKASLMVRAVRTIN
jgi:hypothetical protein